MIDFTSIQTISQLWPEVVKQYPNRTLFRAKTLFNTRSFTYAEVDRYLHAIGHFLVKQKLRPGDRILIVGINSPAMAMLLLAAYQAGLVVVPADVRASGELLQKYYRFTKPKLVVASQWRWREVSMWSKAMVLEDLLSTVRPWLDQPAVAWPEVKPNDLAEIMFTSGTTGIPKGVQLTHRNIISNVRDLQPVVPRLKHFEALSILPLSHIFEQVIGLLIPISVGGTISYVRKVNSVTLKRALQEWPISHLVVVPQVLKNLYRSIEQQAHQKPVAGLLFGPMLAIAQWLPMGVRRVLFGSVHRALGGHIKFIVTAGAKLDPHIGHVWELMGFPIMEGYGATEVSAAATVNLITDRLIGSVGYPLKHVQIRIDRYSHEVLIKGPGVSPGYYRNPQKTTAAFTKGGWYRTGDIGELRQGRLFLLGRDAFKIVLSSGENVYVEDLESQLNDQPEIWESCVLAHEEDGREQVHAALVPAPGVSEKQLNRALKRVNQELESHQQITFMSVWPEADFPRTITQKINRAEVARKLAETTTVTEPSASQESSEDPLFSIVSMVSKRVPAELSNKLMLGNDLQLDSIDRVELIAMAEEEFGVQLDDYQVSAETTIGQLRSLIEHSSRQQNIPWGAHWPFWWPTRFIRAVLLKFVLGPLQSLWIPTTVHGLEHLHSIKPPAVVLFNHIGFFDVLVYYRHFTFKQLLSLATVATEDFWLNSFKLDEWAIQLGGGGIPVAPDHKGGARTGLLRIGKALDQKLLLNIAPEGHIARNQKVNPFRRGIGLIATEMAVPITIVTLVGPYTEVFPVNDSPTHTMSWWKYLPRWRRRRLIVDIAPAQLFVDQDPEQVTRHLEAVLKKTYQTYVMIDKGGEQ